MIARLTGTLAERSPQSLILDVKGIGYEVLLSLGTYQQLPKLGETISLHIHTHVREDELVLFGFWEVREKLLFKRLIRVNGVGARLALNILSGISAEQLIEALRREDLLRITAIPGVGKKTGERLILDLKDKLMDLQGEIESRVPLREDLLSVLLNLGYKRNSAEKAVQELQIADDTPLQEAIKLTLQQLGGTSSRASSRTEVAN